MQRKVLWVHEKHGNVGGAERSINSSALGIKDRFRSFLLYSDYEEAESATCFEETFQVPFTLEESDSYEKTQDILRKLQPDIIYIHRCLSTPVMRALLNHPVTKLRMVHDHEIYCVNKTKYNRFTRKICDKKAGVCCLFPGLAFVKRNPNFGFSLQNPHYYSHHALTKIDKKCDRFLSVTPFMIDSLTKQGYPKDRLSVMTPAPFHYPPQEFTPTFSEENKIVYLGQLLRGKGVDFAIRAFAKVRAPATLTILGSGNYERVARKLCFKLGIEDKVSFEGRIESGMLSPHLKDATVGLVPSVWPEPLALVGQEFMLHQIPVVGFDVGGISYWLKDGENGYLVASQDVSAMSERIETLLQDKAKARQMGQKGHTLISKQFSRVDYLDRLSKELLEEYHV